VDEVQQTFGAEVLADIGFSHAEAEEFAAKTALSLALETVMKRQGLRVPQAATLCGVDQAALSGVMRGHLETVTLGRLAAWLTALGQDVEITVKPAPNARHGRLHVAALG
jgi:predicted XRE-type DNA-binding protein